MQFSIIRLGIVNVETKGLKWLEEKMWFSRIYLYILPVILSFGLKSWCQYFSSLLVLLD